MRVREPVSPELGGQKMDIKGSWEYFKRRRRFYTGCVGVVLCGLFSPVKLGIVSGHSMSPTMRSGQPYLLDRASYLVRPVRRGDVLVFDHAGDTYVKRVAATAGDTVYLVRDGSSEDVLVMDWQLPILRRAMNRYPGPVGVKLVRRVVPPGYIYVLGDNMDNSVDSREFGPVPTTAVRGRVLGVSGAPAMLAHLAGNFTQPSAS